MRALENGGFELEIADDGVGERRRASLEAIDERVQVLNGRLSVEHGEAGRDARPGHRPLLRRGGASGRLRGRG